MIQNNRALEAAFRRAGTTDVSSLNLRKSFATRLLSRGAAITDVQHLLGHASVKTTEKAYAAFVKNERFKQTIDLLDQPGFSKLKIVRRRGSFKHSHPTRFAKSGKDSDYTYSDWLVRYRADSTNGFICIIIKGVGDKSKSLSFVTDPFFSFFCFVLSPTPFVLDPVYNL